MAELENTFSSSEQLALFLGAQLAGIFALESSGKGKEVVGEVSYRSVSSALLVSIAGQVGRHTAGRFSNEL